MAAPFALPGILAAFRSALVADATLTAKLAVFAAGFGTGPGIYSESGVPPKAGFPYLTIGAPTEMPFDTMGDAAARGSTCTIQVKALSARMHDDEALAIMGDVKRILDEADLPIAGYGSVQIQCELVPDLFVEVVRDVTIRHLPMIFRVYVHQS